MQDEITFKEQFESLLDELSRKEFLCGMQLESMEYRKGIAYTSPLDETLYVYPDFEQCHVYAHSSETISSNGSYIYTVTGGNWSNASNEMENLMPIDNDNPIIVLLYDMWNRYLVSKYSVSDHVNSTI